MSGYVLRPSHSPWWRVKGGVKAESLEAKSGCQVGRREHSPRKVTASRVKAL